LRLLTATFAVFALMAAGAMFLIVLAGLTPLLVKPLLCPDGEYQTVTFQTPNPEFPSENITIEQLQCVTAGGEATPVNASLFSTALIILAVLSLLAGLIALFQLGASAGKRVALPPGPTQPVSQLSDPLRAEALALLGKGRKIEAVKRVREETGLSLKESKDVVDWLEAGQTL
jgi:hypothetical protein